MTLRLVTSLGGREPSPVAQRNARAAAVIARGLAPEPTDVVISPGSRSTALALAFRALPDARLHVVLDERAAGFVALGIARSLQRPAILLATSGSAGAHYLPAVIEARHARVPLVALTADRPAELQGCGAPQTVAQARLFGEHLRHQLELPLPDEGVDDRWLAMAVSMARARALGQGAPAGPVHVNAPFREPLWEQGATAIATEAPPAVTSGPRRLDEAELDALARELACERGVIVCGPLAPATLDDEALARSVGSLARTLGWPVIADAASGVRFGGEAPVVGFADAWLRCPEPAAAFAPERVLRVGLHPSSKSIAQWLAQHGRGRTILVDADGEWLDPAAAARRLVVAEPAWLFEALARRMEPQGRAWLARWQRIDEAAAAVLGRACAEDGWEGAVARAVVEALPERAQLHLGSSMPIRDVDAFAPALDRRLRVHANRGCNGIDGSLSTALGEALAAPERPTVALLGDLTFLHDLDGLEAASMLAARLVVVVVHNRGGGIFRHLPIAGHREAFDELFVTARDADIGALARAMGIAHALVEPRPAALRDALREAIERARPSILEVRIDPDHDLERHQRAWASVARAVEQEERKWK